MTRADAPRFVQGRLYQTEGCVEYQIMDGTTLSTCGNGAAFLTTHNGAIGFDMETDRDDLGFCEGDTGLKMKSCHEAVPMSSDGAGYVYKLAPDLRVSVGLDKSFTMNTNPKDPAHAIIVVGVPPLDRDQEEKSKMKTPTANNDADRLLAASDPQASSATPGGCSTRSHT